MMRFAQTHGQEVVISPLPPISLPNDNLGIQLTQNWLSKNPAMEHLMPQSKEKDPLEDSLTSLNWLQNMNLNIGASTPPISPRPKASIVANSENMRVNPNQVLATNLKQSPFQILDIQAECLDPVSFEKIDYKTNPYVKPPYSYATLICMAMKASRKNKVTLAMIYNWITEHFMYYRMADPSWQNSIRHNLSLNKCFQKVARRKDEPGKGGFWRINPDYNALLDNGLVKKKCKPIESRSKRLSDDTDLPPNSSTRKKSRRSTSDEDSEAALSLAEYLNMDRLLNQDIEVGGIAMRAEDILDSPTTDSFVTLSPPPSSEENTSDCFEDLLGGSLSDLTSATSATSQGFVVQGVKIEPPEWWGESLTGHSFNGLLGSSLTSGVLHDADKDSHPWTADKSDIETALIEMESILNSSFNS